MWGTCGPNLVTLGLLGLELFVMHAMDRQTGRQTDRRMDKSNAYCTFPTGGDIRNDIEQLTYEYR